MTERILNATQSLCPHCLRRIPAWNVRRADDVWLVKECPEHGRFATVIWRGHPAYETWGYAQRKPGVPVCATQNSRGCPFDCGLCPEHHHAACAVLLEITSRCNLRCPVCFADAGEKEHPDPDLSTIRSWYAALYAQAGDVNIQLSGGEPTVREDLPKILALGKEAGFSFLQINTNGLRLGADNGSYAQTLKDAGLACAFVQFDGLDDAIYRHIRGRNLLQVKLRAIENCAAAGIGIVQAVTLVPHVNMHALGDLVRFAVRNMPFVRGLHFQPVGYIGRYPKEPGNEDHITLPEVMRALEEQTEGLVRVAHFLPPAGENPHCSFHANFTLLEEGSLEPWVQDGAALRSYHERDHEDGSLHARRFMSRQWRAAQGSTAALQAEPAADSAPESQALEAGLTHDLVTGQTGHSGQSGQTGQSEASAINNDAATELDRRLARMQTHSLSISAMAFQDVWNLDLARLRDCHIGIFSRDARIIPFCAYNLTSSTGQTLYRNQDLR